MANKWTKNPVSLADRFWQKVIKTDTCWLWIGSADRKGYGQMRIEHRLRYATHVAYELQNGPVLQGYFVLHSCDNPQCVRGSHLTLGSHQQNMREMVDRNRSAKGEGHSQRVLTDESVRLIRKLNANGVGYRKLHRMFKVGRATVADIATRKTWKHV